MKGAMRLVVDSVPVATNSNPLYRRRALLTLDVTKKRGVVTLRYTLPRRSRISLVVYSVLGREIRRLVDNRTVTSGSHTVLWDAVTDRTAGGCYLVRLSDGKHALTKRVMLVR